MSQRVHSLAVIGGDGIGPEVTAAALEVVAAAGVSFDVEVFDLGAARYLRDGFVLDDATLERLRGFDAIMLGAIGPAIGDTRIPGGTLERGLLLRLRFGLDLYINYRPSTGSRAPSPRAATSRSCARTPRAPTRARAGPCAGARPTRWPPRAR